MRSRVLYRDRTTHRAFSARRDGDLRTGDRGPFSAEHRCSVKWATAIQVHGSEVMVVSQVGAYGPADALVTRSPDLPVAIFTADCLGLVFEGDGVVGVAHAGWRGLRAGVLEATREAMSVLDGPPKRVTAGPGIRACCFEVGPEVAGLFSESLGQTTWGTPSVDLVAESKRRLSGVDFDVVGGCTKCDDSYFSYRNGDIADRMAAVGWLD